MNPSRRAIAAGILFSVLFGVARGAQLPPSELDAIAGYLTELKRIVPEFKVLAYQSSTASSSEIFVGAVPSVAELQKQLPNAGAAVLQDFLRVFDHSAQVALSQAAASGLRLHPVSDAKLIELFDHKPLSRAWTEFKKAFPGATGLARFSRVGFDASSQQALLFVSMSPGGLGGVGKLVLIQRSGTQWRIVEESQVWVS